MKLLVISAAEAIPGEALRINELFKAGLPCLHLRKPAADAAVLQEIIGQIHPDYYRRLVLHDHYHLAFQWKLRGIHLPETSRGQVPPQVWTDLLQKIQQHGMTLSTSVHRQSMLQRIPACYDYVFYSPVFPSISKPGYQPQENMDVCALTIEPDVIALGGIEAANIRQVQQMGYDGVALMGTLWQNPGKAVTEYQKIKAVIAQA